MRNQDRESGEVMLEGMIVVIITMFMILWILGIGFLHYQRYLVTIVTNDTAEKIAATYTNPTRDPVIGFTKPSEMIGKSLYGSLEKSDLQWANSERADAYIKYILSMTNFTGVVKEIKTRTQLVKDSKLRNHLEITTDCTFNTPFGFALSWSGIQDTVTYSYTARADCTDMQDYIFTTDFSSNFRSGGWLGSKAIKMINSLLKLTNGHKYAKS